MSLLKLSNVTKRFDGFTAVDGVSFEVAKGAIGGLIGPNGAGKTTFVSMLIGRLAADAGQVIFEGRDITALPDHRRVALGMAYTFQITSVFSRLSLEENVALAARRRLGHDKGAIAGEVMQALTRVSLADRMAQIAGDLSYGHQRLLEIAMGLAQRPRLLILDEPTQGLAENEIADFKDLIRTLVPDTTILLIEHNMSVVMDVADRVTVLNGGAVLAEGTPAEIHENAAVQAAYLGTG